MLARGFHCDGLAGFHSSAVSTALLVGAELNPTALVPPVTRTVPSARSVRLCWRRATAMAPTKVQVTDPARSICSAVLVGVLPPPTRRIFPASYMTAEP